MNKFLFSIVVLLTLSLNIKAQGYSGGSGTNAEPYLIETLSDLQYLSEHSEHWSFNFSQISDIDASDTENWNLGEGFSPIGNDTVRFTGSYNGNSHTINSLFINRPSQDYIGLFGLIRVSYIGNIGITNADIIGRSYVGALVGYNEFYCTVSYSYSTGFVTGTGGWGLGTGVFVGGLVGKNYQNSNVENSYSTSSVIGYNRVGGLVGDNVSLSNETSTIKNSFSAGSVVGHASVGGLAGGNTNSIISNSYSTSSVTENHDAFSGKVGGLVGSNWSEIENSYCIGLVSGISYPGGLVGYNSSISIEDNSFWNIEVYTIDNGLGTGKTTDEMKDLCMYLNHGWDFVEETINGLEDIWVINSTENDGYPVLSWQGIASTEICCGYTSLINTENVTDVVCESELPYAFGTQSLDESGVYTEQFQSINGCDSMVTLNLIINNNTGVDFQMACESFTWIDGITYYESNNIATDTLISNWGCDSVVILNLTINSLDLSLYILDPSISSNAIDVNYQWLNCSDNFSIVNGATEQTFTAEYNGDYCVKVMDGVCVDTSDCVNISTVEIMDKLLINQNTIYPNPTQSKVTVNYIGLEKIKIVDVTGKTIKQYTSEKDQMTIDLSNQAKGIYLFKIYTEKGISTQKIVLE